MEKKNTVLLTVIAVATLLVAIVGATFAYFSANITETDKTETVIKSAELGVIFDGTQEIEANSIEPGWSAQKKFTVENKSDYDMTFDINFTKVVNTFSRTQELTYTSTASYAEGSNGKTYGTTEGFGTTGAKVQMVGLTETNVANGAKSEYSASGVLPVDGNMDTTKDPAEPVYGTGVTKAARVFIPAHAKEEFTFTIAYAYKGLGVKTEAVEPSELNPEGTPAEYYVPGDPNDPNNQNVDQGKYFRTTFAIVTNGIDSTQSNNKNNHEGSNNKGEYPTNNQTPVNAGN